MTNPVRFLVTGSRDWACRNLAKVVIGRLINRYANLVIVHGDCPTGVDAAFDAAAKEQGIAVEPHPARRDDLNMPGAIIRRRRDGMAYVANAGPIRNAEMVNLGAEACIAVHKNLKSSKGTLGCVRLALETGIRTVLIDNDEGLTRWLTKEDLT